MLQSYLLPSVSSSTAPAPLMAARAISWLQILQQDPTLLDIISFYDMVLFVNLACHLRERIRWNQSDDVTGPPINLPISVHNFLCDALEAEDHLVRSLWSSLRQLVWADTFGYNSHFPYERSPSLMPLFLKYGPAHGIGTSFYYMSLSSSYILGYSIP